MPKHRQRRRMAARSEPRTGRKECKMPTQQNTVTETNPVEPPQPAAPAQAGAGQADASSSDDDVIDAEIVDEEDDDK